MGVSIDLHSYNYEELVEGIFAYTGATTSDDIERVLDVGGTVIGDTYIILNNELWDGCSPYYNIPSVLDKLYGVSDTFGEVFCTFNNLYGHRTLTNACDTPEEILDELFGKEN